MTHIAPPARDPELETASFTLSDADITSQRAVPRPRLPGVLGAGAAAQAFGSAAGASDHDGPPNTARPAGAPKPAPDGDG